MQSGFFTKNIRQRSIPHYQPELTEIRPPLGVQIASIKGTKPYKIIQNGTTKKRPQSGVLFDITMKDKELEN
ncbi:hypothetical protein AMJ44_09925 [candidate division WOR-1 bacterium DG_54_3]|uniref:Uncharacterized protein n=1 Tax=candidate division WOR-1 bacterium DG_54_3 TaxID=1703775 RepID=A0A0S7XSW6_UNCSA|nr:MAG: hypothetical protein AMJ44_09925 [candidate division WOR-1 bacterium DG_54_3]